MSDLTDKMITAAEAAAEDSWSPETEYAGASPAAVAAAPRVLADEGYHLVVGPKHLYLDAVAAEIEAGS